ncbi:MAG: hypothetical protein JWR80_5993 [Bradyrhizobium sp.]|nr:hypothetical protein [Bradyrhizobium sp.]
MADIYLQACFSFTCTPAEMVLLEEAFQASYDLGAGLTPSLATPSPAFLSLFPPTEDDCWAGFREIFSDPSFPMLGAGLTGSDPVVPPMVTAIISTDADFEPEAMAKLIQRCCPAMLANAPIGFEWSVTCSRMRVGEFGGGWCAIFPDRIERETTGESLAAALSGEIL